jgi:hypothetical protein
MTVSNPASLSSATAEFSGPGSLSALVRGGSYVAAGASASISTAVAGLALSQFNGVTKPASVSFASFPRSVSHQAVTGKPGGASLILNANGTYGGTNSGTWVSPAGSYDVFVTANNGNGSGTLNTWVNVAGQTWSVSIGAGSGGQSVQCTFTFQIRQTGTSTVLATITCSITSSN